MAVALGALEFVVRAFARTRSNWLSDLAAPYLSTRLWLQGANPYDPLAALKVWYASGGAHLPYIGIDGAAYSVYPPPTLMLTFPLALLRWHPAVYVFMMLGMMVYAAVVYGLVRLGWPQHRSLSSVSHDPLAMYFIAFALGFAPIHTAFHSMNIVLFSCCAAILATLASFSELRLNIIRKPRPRAVGLLVGIGVSAAILIKPTTGIFLLPWLVRERRWRWLAGILTACIAVTALSFGLLLARQGLSWLPDYQQNVTGLFTHGGNADVSAVNPNNTDRIDLQMPAFAALGNRTLASAAAAIVYVGLLIAFLQRAGWRKSSDGRGEVENPLDLSLLVAAGCLALGLLPSYSRVYSAIVLLPLVFWCFHHLQFKSARWILLLLADFLLNTSAIVRLIGEKLGLIARAPRLWDFTIGGHTCWLLLAVGCLLVYAVYQQTGEATHHAAAFGSAKLIDMSEEGSFDRAF